MLIVRKRGVPCQPELALGAIASRCASVMNDDVVDASGISSAQLDAIIRTERAELERREHLYRATRPLNARDRVVIVVDDGLATGASMRASSVRAAFAAPCKNQRCSTGRAG